MDEPLDVMLVDRTHRIDQTEPDEGSVVTWSYEYDILTLRASSGRGVTARTYADTPHQVSLLRFTLRGAAIGQGDVKRSHMDTVRAFASFLRNHCFDSVIWQGGEGYVDVPA